MRKLFFVASFATFYLFSCQNQPVPKMTGLAGNLQDSSIVRIWPLELDSLKKINPNIPIIDVRTELQFRTSHIFRSINCSVDAPDFSQRIMRLGVENPVVVYDEDSSLSLIAAQKMTKLGFKRVYELAGGIFSWAREGKTLVSGTSNIDSSTILK